MTNTTIKTGKMDFSVKSAKAFRDGLAQYHNATFEIADQILQVGESVKSLQTLINTNMEKVKRIDEGDTSVIGNRADLVDEIDTFTAKVDNYRSQLAEYKKAQADRLDKGYVLLTDDLYEAYKDYLDGKDPSEAIATWFTAQGLVPTDEGIDLILRACGKKKSSARQKCKTGKHLDKLTKNAWRDIFLGALCDELTQDAEHPVIPIYKFKYVLKDKRTKKSDK